MTAFERTPFRWTQQQLETAPVEVDGSVPPWVRGQLMRTAPAVFESNGWRAGHLFDGLALIYGFTFGEGVQFRQRLLSSKARAAIERGKQVGSFDTVMQRKLWRRLLQPIPPVSDNTNVNIVPWQEHWLAMTESQIQHCIDRDTLDTRGPQLYDDELPRAMLMTAHPQLDPRGDALVNVGTQFGQSNAWVVFRQPLTGRARVVEGRLPLSRVPYLHSFGVTRRHVVLVGHPLTVNPMRMLFSNRGYIDHFRWKPERGTRFWKLDRRSGSFTSYEADPLFCFHTVSAFERGDELVLDLLAYDDAAVVSAFRTEQLASGAFPTLMPKLVRARLLPNKRRAILEPLSDQRFEFPVLGRPQAEPYGHAWGVHLREGEPGAWSSELVRVDLKHARTQRHVEPHFTYGEPVFVPRPDGHGEDDGVLLALGHHAQRELSVLLVLDARTLEPLARCTLPLSLPLGFHGSFRAA